MDTLKQLFTKPLYDVKFVKNYILNGKGIGLKFATYFALIYVLFLWGNFFSSIYWLIMKDNIFAIHRQQLQGHQEIIIKNGEIDSSNQYVEATYKNNKEKYIFIINSNSEDILKEKKKAKLYFGKKQAYISFFDEIFDYTYDEITFNTYKEKPINLANTDDFSRTLAQITAKHTFFLIASTIPIIILKFIECIIVFFIMSLFAKGKNKSAKELGKKEYRRLIAITFFVFNTITLILVALPIGIPNYIFIIILITSITLINQYDFSAYKENKE